MTLKFLSFLYLISIFICNKKDATIIQEKNSDVTFEWVVNDVEIPWGMAFLPDGSFLYTEKRGIIFYYKDGKKTEVGRPPDVYNRGQGGLLDICLHPKFSENNFIYLTLARKPEGENGGNTALIRAEFDGEKVINYQVLYQAKPFTTAGHHFGSRIVFDENDYVYFTIGDRGERDLNPQNPKSDGGKVYRLHDDGRIPADNPFSLDNGNKSAVFSYGHRNPQGMTIHPETGEIWAHEHGPKGGDEINIVKKGNNYGWPVITYGLEYSGLKITDQTSKPGMEQPLYYWIPSIAPSGMTFVNSDKYPEWKGNLLVGSLVFEYLERLELKDNKVVKRTKLLENLGRVRNVIQSKDGYIYVSIENKGILRIKSF
ncbi:MAG: PQQ-dependent sugar dehydrogenase [Saprospiraceae bacterium]|nr:PQQ-dependent sugar dehydrogenase [Saprospiraceae bacterium]